jgi:tetratricopeptide (TPR) repeat protein
VRVLATSVRRAAAGLLAAAVVASAWGAVAWAEPVPGPEEAYDAARRAQIAATRKGNPEDYLDAVRAFDRYLDLYPQHRLVFEARFGRAESLLAAGEVRLAWEAYGELRELDPERRVGDVLAGEAFVVMAMMDTDDDPELREMFQGKVAQLRQTDPRNDRLPALLAASAYLYRKQGQRGEAAEVLALLVDNWPGSDQSADAWDDLGSLRVQLGDHQGAIKAYRGYLQHFPEGDRALEIRCLMAFSYLELSEFGDAVVAGETLLGKLTPKKSADHQRLWTETIKILANAQAETIRSPTDLDRRLQVLDQPWSLEVVVAILAVQASRGDADLALEGLDTLERRELLVLDNKASDGLREQLVSCCYALRDVRPDAVEVQRWLLVAAQQLDTLGRLGESGQLLQWIREHTDSAAIRREAREIQLRGSD